MTDPKNKNAVLEKQETRTAKPKLFRVILLNDDYTTMEFVVFVLESVFHKNTEEATQLMLQIHHSGRGIAGVFTFEIAEMKALTVIEMARQNEYPLQAIIEAE